LNKKSGSLNRGNFFLIWTFFLLLLVFSLISSSYAGERKQPLAIPPHPPYQNPYLTKGTIGFCYVQYDDDSLSWYWNAFGNNKGIAVYMDPALCGADSVYPFKITNVYFYLYDFNNAVWPVDLNVNIRQARLPEDSIKTPGEIIFFKSYTIPSDSGYTLENPRPPINLSLDTTFCVNSPFYLELIYTNFSDSNCASLIMSDSTDQPDTNQDWLVLDGKYSRWDTAWVEYIKPGRALMRVTGYPQAIDCDECWYWKYKTTTAPSGTPDFDQNQFGTDTVAFDGSSALADGLVWLNAVPPDTDPDSLIRLLSGYVHTHPYSGGGTDVDSIRLGLESFFVAHGLNCYDVVLQNPTFTAIADSLVESGSIVLLLGLWQNIGDVWYRIGGHYVSLAGTCFGSSWAAISDPAFDETEKGAKGRILPAHDQHPDDHVLHNTPGFVSQDVYLSETISLGPYEDIWRLKDYYDGNLPWLSQFEGQNFQPDQEQYAHAYDSTAGVYAVVEYAIIINSKSSAVPGEQTNTPGQFELFPNFPNPFNNQTVIKYTLSKPEEVSLVIYNILGQKIRTLVRDEKQNGTMNVAWNGKDDSGKEVSSGIYFYRLKAGEYTQTKRMVLLK
jgi:hypothetical protein